LSESCQPGERRQQPGDRKIALTSGDFPVDDVLRFLRVCPAVVGRAVDDGRACGEPAVTLD
jgi:hypothetical protein